MLHDVRLIETALGDEQLDFENGQSFRLRIVLLCLTERAPRTFALLAIHVDRSKTLPGLGPQRRAWRLFGRRLQEFELASGSFSDRP